MVSAACPRRDCCWTVQPSFHNGKTFKTGFFKSGCPNDDWLSNVLLQIQSQRWHISNHEDSQKRIVIWKTLVRILEPNTENRQFDRRRLSNFVNAEPEQSPLLKKQRQVRCARWKYPTHNSQHERKFLRRFRLGVC